MAARLSIIVPTPDGEGLRALFQSIRPQLDPADEVIIVGDTHDGPLDAVQLLTEAQGENWRYIPHDAGHHCWGHCQINAGLQIARGDYLVFNDDDDVFTEGAFDAIRRAIGHQPSPRPLMFKFHCQRLGRTLPERYAVEESAIGGHCLVTPNIAGRIGRWGERYGGDFDWIASTLSFWPEGPAWYDDVIAIAR
jgi:glycosyltransferase involved in cell wall biosynthesis